MASVLVVDDSPFMRNVLTTLLESFGHKVLAQVADGAEAVDLYNELKPDLVTLDISMPGLNGLDALDAIMAHDKMARVIMVTADAQREDAIRAYEAGAAGYILKPFDRPRVADMLAEVL